MNGSASVNVVKDASSANMHMSNVGGGGSQHMTVEIVEE